MLLSILLSVQKEEKLDLATKESSSLERSFSVVNSQFVS